MDGNEEGDDLDDIGVGDSVWEQEAASLSMFEPRPLHSRLLRHLGVQGGAWPQIFSVGKRTRGRGRRPRNPRTKRKAVGRAL